MTDKTYDTKRGFTTLASAAKAITSAYASFTDAASAQLEAMRELGANIFRLENRADLVKLGFTDEKGVKLAGKKLTDALAAFYADTCNIPDSSFISDARARGIAMAVTPKLEVGMTREVFKKLAPVYRDSKLGSFEERGKVATATMAQAEKLAKKAGSDSVRGRDVAQARQAPKRGTRGNTPTPIDTLVEASATLAEAIGAVRAEDILTLSDNERAALEETHAAFGRILANATTVAANKAKSA